MNTANLTKFMIKIDFCNFKYKDLRAKSSLPDSLSKWTHKTPKVVRLTAFITIVAFVLIGTSSITD